MLFIYITFSLTSHQHTYKTITLNIPIFAPTDRFLLFQTATETLSPLCTHQMAYLSLYMQIQLIFLIHYLSSFPSSLILLYHYSPNLTYLLLSHQHPFPLPHIHSSFIHLLYSDHHHHHLHPFFRYIFKGDEELPFLPLHRQSAYLIGRDRKVADIPTDHPSCSKQHAVLQYRLVTYNREDGTKGKTQCIFVIIFSLHEASL